MKRRPSYDEAEHNRSRKSVKSVTDFGLFETPEGPEPPEIEISDIPPDPAIGELLDPGDIV